MATSIGKNEPDETAALHVSRKKRGCFFFAKHFFCFVQKALFVFDFDRYLKGARFSAEISSQKVRRL